MLKICSGPCPACLLLLASQTRDVQVETSILVANSVRHIWLHNSANTAQCQKLPSWHFRTPACDHELRMITSPTA